MKILITGATGLVGTELVKLCHQQKLDVHYLSRNRNSKGDSNNFKGFYWNPSKNEIDVHCFKGVSAIINLAGASIPKRWTSSYKETISSSRLDSLRTLRLGLEMVDYSQISSFCSASAIAIYPDSFTEYYTEEEKNSSSSFLGTVVREWEREADTFQKFNFNIAKIRIGMVMTSKGGALPKFVRPVKYGLGATFGTGEQWISWIHINDLTRMLLFIVEHRLMGIYNGVAPNPITNKKLLKELAHTIKKPLILPGIPKFILKTVLGEMSSILFSSQRVSSKKIEEQGFCFNFPNIYRTLEHLHQK